MHPHHTHTLGQRELDELLQSEYERGYNDGYDQAYDDAVLMVGA